MPPEQSPSCDILDMAASVCLIPLEYEALKSIHCPQCGSYSWNQISQGSLSAREDLDWPFLCPGGDEHNCSSSMWSSHCCEILVCKAGVAMTRAGGANMEILDRIDWASVNWLYVAVLTALVFFSTLIGALLSFKRAFRTAVLSALLFAAGFVFWTYYPHGLPLPTSVTAQKAPDSLRPNERLSPPQ